MTHRYTIGLCVALAGFANAPQADTLVATRTIRAQSLIMPDDLELAQIDMPGALETVDEAVGLEARVVLYAGRPIHPRDIGPPALVDRNQIVPLVYRSGGLTIATEGRALDRGGVGDTVRILNISSRTTVSGIVGNDGRVLAFGSTKSR